MRTISAVLLLAAALGLLVLNAGDHTWIQATAAYQLLATMVALNTLGFALIASLKMGYRSGRAAQARRA